METESKFSKSSILTVGGLALMLGGLIATVSITLAFSTSQGALRDEIKASNATLKENIQSVKDQIGANLQATKDEQKAAVQSVKDEVRDRTAELATRMGDIKQKMEISDLKMVDRWSGTDMRRLWSELARVWIELKRTNPGINWPDFPEIR